LDEKTDSSPDRSLALQPGQHNGFHRYGDGDLRVLAVTMASLFSTSVTSSATQNDTRRAYYYYESGIRYSGSELINNTPKFSSTTIDKLNTTTYKIAETVRSR